MVTSLSHLEGVGDSPFTEGGGGHHGWHARWDRFRDDFRHTSREVLAVVTGGAAVVSLLGGVAIGRLTSPAEADAGTPNGNPNGVAGALPFPSSSAKTGNVIPSQSPTASSGDFNTTSNWNVTCTSVSHEPVGNGLTKIKPVLTLQSGASNPNFTYTFVDYGNNQDPDVAVAAHGITSVEIQATAENSLGPIAVGVIYFPDGRHQPGSLSDVTSGDLGITFPEAQIVTCPVLTTEDLG